MYIYSTWPNNHLNHLLSAKGEEGLGWWSSAKGGRIASCWGQSQSFDQNKIEIGTKPWWIGRFGGKREKGMYKQKNKLYTYISTLITP